MRFDLVLANAVATLAFAIIFQVPKKEYVFCMVSGAVAYLGFLAFRDLGSGPASSTFASTFLLTVMARFFAGLRRCPVTIYIMSGIIPLVNGLGVFNMVQALIAGNRAEGATQGINVLSIALSIALGLGFAFAIPHSLFHRFILLLRRKK